VVPGRYLLLRNTLKIVYPRSGFLSSLKKRFDEYTFFLFNDCILWATSPGSSLKLSLYTYVYIYTNKHTFKTTCTSTKITVHKFIPITSLGTFLAGNMKVVMQLRELSVQDCPAGGIDIPLLQSSSDLSLSYHHIYVHYLTGFLFNI